METRKFNQRRVGSAPRPSLSDAPGCLHEIFEAQVDLNPEAPALIWNGQTLSYSQLESEANRLARHLRAKGAGPGRFVGLFFEKSRHPIIAILAVLKSGAAYVPIDPTCPSERMGHILGESESVLLLTESRLRARAREAFTGPVLDLDELAPAVAAESSARISRLENGASSDDVCYVIYTSGTTGRPKGVMAVHQGAARYAHAFNEICGTGPADRVYQGFALTFDGSVEEIWMAFSNGSALVTGTNESPRFGNELGAYLASLGVTYFSTVPTLLSTITDEVASLKTVVVSGEVCPAELVARWARPTLRLLNVYGPTEATVNTTAFECAQGRPVTIGKPLAGYGIHILGEDLEPVAPGAKGELFVGGETLARGYLKQPELTAEKFMQVRGERLYRTGDLVRWNEAGELEFFGRIDGQVKIRGYRVELGEIESVILEQPRVSAAAVRLIDRNGLQELAAYVMLDDASAELDRAALLEQLEKRVPPYMVPGFLDVLPEFPRLASGKIDRKQLPPPMMPLIRATQDRKPVVEPESALEKKIAAIWAGIFGLPKISVTDDFFLDLGGHSLLAARMVTAVREATNRNTTVRDAYGCPTVRKLATHLSALPELGSPEAAASGTGTVRPSARTVFESVPRAERLIVSALMALSTVLIYGLVSVPFTALFLAGLSWYRDALSLGALIGLSLATALATWPLFLGVAVAAKWLILGRYREESIPLWSYRHFRHWLAGRFIALSGSGLLGGTPLLPFYLRLMGARVGRGCILDTAGFGAYDLLAIGDDTSIGADTQIPGYRVEGGMLTLGRATIGSRCFIGNHSALGLNTRMEDDSRLGDQSLLPDGQTIGICESRRGSPAQPGEVLVPEPARGTTGGAFRRPILFGLAQLALIEAMAIVGLLPAIPFLVLYYHAFDRGVGAGIAALVASVPVGFVVACLWVVVLKKAILAKAKPGVYPIESVFYLRKWLSDGIMKAARATLLPVYTTLYFPAWLRLLGAKIGARAELSTVWSFSPELVEVGEESFFADGSIVGGKRFFRGRFEIGVNRIGRRSFVGNSAILPMGQSMGDNGLLGVQSIPPTSASGVTPDGSEWLGSPAFALPNRPKITSFDLATTYKPSRKLYAQRAVIDALRILIPGYIALAVLVASVAASVLILDAFGRGALFASAPLVALALGIAAALSVVALKKAVMGEFKPVIVPLWSMYVWLNEMVNGVYESVMAPAIAPFLGTPFVAPFLRAIGCRIGKNAYIESTLFSEWDLVEIGDYAALNAGAIIQTHLFEDRVMKSSHLKVGAECSVGNMAVVLYDTEMQTGSSIAPLSLLMKGETLAPRTRWHGIPTVQIPAALMAWEKESMRFNTRKTGTRRFTASRKKSSPKIPLVASLAREVLG